MKTTNIPSGSLRVAETGLVWEEVITNGNGTVKVPRYSTVRVRAAAAVTVTIDGVLAMTMASGEIERFCVGVEDTSAPGTQSTVVITGTAFVQVGREVQKRAN